MPTGVTDHTLSGGNGCSSESVPASPMPTSSKEEKQKRVVISAGNSYRRQAAVLEGNRRVTAADDTRSSAPVLTFHLLSGRASVSSQYVRTYSRTYSDGSGGEGCGLGGCRSWQELVEVMARQHKLPIGAHRNEELERRTSMDIRHPQWSMLVVTPDNISWPTRGPNVDATIGSTMRSRAASGRKAPVNETIRRSSSPGVVVPDSACHAGGRGFESRRSRFLFAEVSCRCCGRTWRGRRPNARRCLRSQEEGLPTRLVSRSHSVSSFRD
jgi:hypothetical protein